MNTTTLESSAFAAWPGKRERQVRLIIPLICLGAILLGPRYTEADKSPPTPKIIITDSPDFPDMTFVLYRLKMFNPWDTGSQVDPAGAIVVPLNTEFDCAAVGERLAVLAVPRAVAEKAKGRADPAWLEPSASGVVRVGELVTVPNVYPDRVFRYRLDKIDDYESTPGDGGLHFRLLNPPAARKHRRARVNRSSPLVAGGVLHVICGILVGGLSAFLIMALCRKAHRLESRQ